MVIKMIKKYKKQALVSILLVSSLALSGFTLQVKGLEQVAKRQLVELGYTQEDAQELVKYTNLHIVAKEKELHLQEEKTKYMTLLETEIGTTYEGVDNVETLTMVEQVSHLADYVDNKRTSYTSSIDQAIALLAQFEVNLELDESLNLVQKQALLTESVATIVEELKYQANKLGATESDISELITDDPLQTAIMLDNEIASLNEKRATQGYYFDRVAAMEMFNQVNAYRASQGLALYTYNHAQQSCVDLEAVAYSSNNNPHNWACTTVANENAGISSVNSDYVKIAMNFFISDPPHHAVLVGNHQSAAVSIVIKNGVAYMILDVFNFN